jgi:hypothetical protein
VVVASVRPITLFVNDVVVFFRKRKSDGGGGRSMEQGYPSWNENGRGGPAGTTNKIEKLEEHTREEERKNEAEKWTGERRFCL